MTMVRVSPLHGEHCELDVVPVSERGRLRRASVPPRSTAQRSRGRAMMLAAAVSILTAPAAARAQSAENVAVVINEASPVSQRIGEYYIKKRAIPAGNVIRIRTSSAETIERLQYMSTIEAPIAAAISRQGLQDRILYIVLTKGVPLRVSGTSGQNGTVASVDSELSEIYRRLTGLATRVVGAVENPYFLGSRLIRDAQRFTHRTQDIFLVTRLDGFTVEDVLGLIDRAQSPSSEGLIVLDQRGGLSEGTGDEWLAEASRRLQDLGHGTRVVLEESTRPAPPTDRVLGYYSWGSNDSNNRRRQFGMKFVPGALAATFVSSDARTFEPPPADWVPSGDWSKGRGLFAGSPQTLIGDLIREGVTGAAGHVAEPYLQSTIRPEILFPAYLAGFNLAEAFYLAMPKLSWQTVVIGDPLCSPFTRAPLTRAEIDEGLNSQTELPALFSKRRLETFRSLLKAAPEPAVTMLLAAEARQARGDTAGLRSALEEATAIDPNIAGAQLQLAGIYASAGEHDKAIERYRIILKMQPNNAGVLNNLAYEVGVHKNAPLEALPLAERAAALAPQNAHVLDTLGWLKHLTGDSSAAAKLLADAARLAPAAAEIRLHNALVNAAIGELATAQAELSQTLRLDPSLAKRSDVLQLQRTLREKKP